MRILLDEEDLSWDQAWQIVTNTFFYTNHTVLPVCTVPDRVQLCLRLNISVGSSGKVACSPRWAYAPSVSQASCVQCLCLNHSIDTCKSYMILWVTPVHCHWPLTSHLSEHVLLTRYGLHPCIWDICNVLEAVEKKFPGDRDRLARMSLIEGVLPLLTNTLLRDWPFSRRIPETS